MATTILPGFPDASTTGVPAGTTLTPHNGDLVIDTPGAVISGLNITGTVYINAPNVTLENCQITSGGYFCVSVADGVAGTTVQDCTLNGAGGPAGEEAICGQGTFVGNNIYNCRVGINVTGPSTIQNNYIHDLQSAGGTAAHYEDILIDGGFNNVTVNHNTLEGRDTACVFICNDFGPMNNISVTNNLMFGHNAEGQNDAAYTIYVIEKAGNPAQITNVTVANNVLGTGTWGFADVQGTSPSWTGNTDLATGRLVGPDNSLSLTGPAAPAAPVITSFSPDTGVSGDGITNANHITLTGTAAPNSTVTIYDGQATLGTAKASSTGSWDYITAVLQDAKHVLTATDTVSGQTSAASAALAVTVDTHAPAAPTLTSDTIVNTDQILVSGKADASSTITIYDGTNVVGTGTVGSNGIFSVTTSALPSGAHVLTATATDAAGNVSVTSQPLDPVTASSSTTPPTTTPPTVAHNPIEFTDVVYSNGVATITGTADASGQIKLYDGTTSLGTVTASASGSWSLTTSSLSDALHSITANEIDSVGHVIGASSGAVVLAASSTSTLAGTGGDDFLFSGTSVLNDTFVLGSSFGHSTIQGFTASGPGQDTIEFSGTIFNSFAGVLSHASQIGQNVVISYGNDTLTILNTNLSSLQSSDFLFDPATVPPPAAPQITSFSSDTGVVGDHITNDNTPTLSGTALANSTVNLFDGTTQVGTATADGSGHWTLTTKALADGTHNLTVTDTSSTGTSPASTAFTVSIDTHVPAAPTIGIYAQNGSAVGAATTLGDLVLKGTAELHSTVDIFDGGHQIGTAITNSSGAWSFDTGQIANGSHSFTAAAVDVAGTTGTASAPDIVSVSTASTPSTPPAATHNPIEFTDVGYSSGVATITGTADAYSQIKLYDGNVSLGTATASANGSWSLTASHLSDTLHTITASELNSAGHVVETSSGTVVLAASNTSILNGTGGDDFLFSSSSNMNDTFAFGSSFGHSVVQGFTVSGPGQDTIQFSKSVFDSFASVLSHASQVGNDVVIASGSNSVTMLNTKLSALHSSDFHFA